MTEMCINLVKENKYYRYQFISSILQPPISSNMAYCCGAWFGVISGFCVEIWSVKNGKKFTLTEIQRKTNEEFLIYIAEFMSL